MGRRSERRGNNGIRTLEIRQLESLLQTSEVEMPSNIKTVGRITVESGLFGGEQDRCSDRNDIGMVTIIPLKWEFRLER